MKLVFPGGEHPQVLLGPGVNRIGSDPRSTIVLDQPGVQPQHCQLHVTAHGVMLEVPHATTVSVNGRLVAGLIALRPGDNVAFDHVIARLASIEPVSAVRNQRGVQVPATAANDDPGATAMRPILPRYVLRAVSGKAFGHNFPLHGVATLGRAPECNLHMDEPGLSRLHARLLPTDDGVLIEDLGSTNGSYINDKRVLRGEARVGDEIGFDTLRFRLMGMGSDHVEAEPPAPAASRVSPWPWVALALVALGAMASAALMR